MQVVIIGAGIVGLHMAQVLQESGNEVFVLDQEPFLGEHTSGRNSGVIHAGIFYTPGSFKEAMCIEGNRLTYEWLEKLKTPYRPCGKWVVPETGQENEIEPFFEKISQLPIPKPSIKSVAEIQSEEPNLRETRGILVPSTGILDAAGYVNHLSAYLEEKGVSVILNCEVQDVKDNTLMTTRSEIPFDLAINSAGLNSDTIAKMTGLENYEVRSCRGDYYILNKNPIKRPVYHLPDPKGHGLGVHLTPTLDDQTLIGPNAFFIDEKEDYDHHTDDKTSFEKAMAYYLPDIKFSTLSKSYSGNRPKLYHRGEPLKEFTIVKKENWIHLLGIESPGLTSAPALARHIQKKWL
jgi:L-2-hydroxyglutarate oxidase LhgO